MPPSVRRRRPHPVVWFLLLFLVGLLPRLELRFFPQILDWATVAGALLAGGAAAFVIRQDMRPKLAFYRWRRFAQRLLAASLPVLILLYIYRVFPVKHGKDLREEVLVPIGFFPSPECCAGVGESTCIENLTLADDAIRSCWGSVSVASVRLALVLSYLGTALACGLWIGLLRLRKPYGSSAGRKESVEPSVLQAPASPATPALSYDLFLSYSNEDRPFVESLATDLRTQGLVIWWDQPQVKAGDSIVSTIEEGLLASRRFAVVLSPSSRRSRWVTKETHAALAVEDERQQRSSGAHVSFVIPVLYQECDVPVFLKDRRHADFRSSYEQGLQELLAISLAGRNAQPHEPIR